MDTSSRDHAHTADVALDEVRVAMRGLTKVQRRFVADGCIHGDFTMATLRALLSKRLFHIVPDSPNGRWGLARLTPLGEAVRAALTEIPQ